MLTCSQAVSLIPLSSSIVPISLAPSIHKCPTVQPPTTVLNCHGLWLEKINRLLLPSAPLKENLRRKIWAHNLGQASAYIKLGPREVSYHHRPDWALDSLH